MTFECYNLLQEQQTLVWKKGFSSTEIKGVFTLTAAFETQYCYIISVACLKHRISLVSEIVK